MITHRALAVTAVLAVVACKDARAPTVATLAEGQGAVTREHAGQDAAAPLGQPFVLGDAVRTGGAAWARLQLRGGPVVRLGADSMVRFVAAGARLERGEAGAEGAAVTLITEAGAAIIEPGGVLRASSADGGVRFEVTVGRAVIQRDGGPVTLEGGGRLVVAIGGAILESPAAPTPTPTPTPTPPPSTATALVATITGRGVTARTGADAPRPLAAGLAAVAPGDVVKLPRGARVELARGDDRATVTGPAELIVGDATGPVLDAKSGTAQLRARGAEVAIAVPGGSFVARVDSDAAVTIGRTESLARVERGEVAVDGTVSDAAARAGETGVLTPAGDAAVRDPVPTSFDVVIAPGEGAVVHDPGRKVAVKIDFAALCGGDGVVELADGKGSFKAPRRISNRGSAGFYATGTTRYRVQCDGGARKSGSVRVVGDSGAAPVVRTAPPNALEADGARYVVTYQNRVPQFTIRWSEAKGATTLKVQPAKGAAQSFSSASGAHVLPPGTLDEGSYTFYIVSGKRTSPPTSVTIAFDNAAPTAQITAPPPRAEWTDPVLVTGVTAEGWRIEVDGKPAPLDGSGRFRAEVATAGRAVFAIRAAHPQHGVNYYLRRRR